jgi:uncharacterized protein GlcG (DUF336 family)
MGCVVNGPGEARHADYGVAGGDGEGVVFRRGEIVGKFPQERLSDALYALAEQEVLVNFLFKVEEKIIELSGDGTAEIIFLPKKILPRIEAKAGADSPGPHGKGCLEGISRELCNAMCDAIQAESKAIGVPVSMAIVDRSGNLRYFYRDPHAILVSMPVAQKKAYTAIAMNCPSSALMAETVPGGSLFGIASADPGLVTFGGGFPLHRDGKLVGGLGISGGTVPEDEQIAKKALEVFNSINIR